MQGCFGQAATTRLRALLRFLYVVGLTPNELAGAVPSVASWRLASLPKAIDAPDVARMLKSCDRRRAMGRRDFAVLMILSRLGLRAGDIALLVERDQLLAGSAATSVQVWTFDEGLAAQAAVSP